MRFATSLLFVGLLPLAAQDPEAPRHLLGIHGPLTDSSSAPAENIAREYLASLASDLSLTRKDLESVYVAKQYRTEHNGVTHVVFRQRFQGADVLNTEWVVNIDRDGRILNAGGRLAATPKEGAPPAMDRARAAVRTAVRVVNPEMEFAAFESDRAPRGRNKIRFAGGALPRDVEGAAVWYSVRGKLHPAWNFSVAHTDRVHRYSVTVDDATQAVLEQRPLTYFQAPPSTPRGMVFERESPQPNPTPGVRLTAAPPYVPRTLQSFQGDSVASPLGWTDGAATAGNNVVVGENLIGTDFLRPTPTLGVNGDFSFPLQLGPGTNPLDYRDSANTNLFYWMNRAHDLHYLYGFDEQAGNFQADNRNRGGVGGDAVFAYTHYGTQALSFGDIENSFFTLEGSDDDGVQPEVSMFLSAAAGELGDFFTDGAYDAQVMVHEYTHGVSSRLARQVYTTFQGAAMGEAWSDFYGLEYTLPNGTPLDGLYPLAQYFDQDWGPSDLRTRPYSTNMDLNPLTYANLGHVIRQPEVHADGEIWVEALWEIRANLIQQFGEPEGRKRARQLVMDGMKLAIPAASMVDMRDAILLADRVDYNGASQGQLWAGFAKRGLGALAYSDGANTAHVSSSFDLPATAGAIKFYDDPIVIGEPLRVVLADANYTQPSVLIQLTTTSGDLENLILHQRGSVYVGSIATRAAAVTKMNTALEVVPADSINAYYVDQQAGNAAQLIQAGVSTMPPYAVSSLPAAFTFSNETRASLSNNSILTYALPFTFPFFDKRYGTALVYSNGLIAFERPVAQTSCTDFINLQNYIGIAPLWSTLSLTGSAQSPEGLFISVNGTDSVTFRWAAEHTAVGGTPSPVNFAATLYADGRIEMSYGSGNTNVLTPSSFSECAPPSYGIANGHGTYSQTFSTGNYTNHAVARFDPPFNNSSLPAATIASPKAGDHVQDILAVSGTASDSAGFVVSVDIFIDGAQRARAVPSGANWSSTLNLASLGVAPGDHNLSLRATNSRGGFSDLPPVAFTVDSGQALQPVVAIEMPVDGDAVQELLSVSGYAYDAGLRITNVDTLIDGLVYPITMYGGSRKDICDPLAAPKPANCPGVGFSALFDTVAADPPIPDGPHKLQVRVRDQTGRFTLYPDTPLIITVSNGPAVPIVGVLEAPASNDTLSGTVTISGYAYSPGHTLIGGNLLVDGASFGSVRFNVARRDICPNLPAANACPNIGFSMTLNTNRLLNGPHVLGISAFNDRGDFVTFPNLVGGGINVFVKN